MNIVQIVEYLNRGAVERWLVEVFLLSRKMRPDLTWTFFCTLPIPGELEEVVRENGGKVVKARASLNRVGSFLGELRALVRSTRCEILHSHHDLISGLYLLGTLGLPIARRIVHVHNTSCSLPLRPGLKKRAYSQLCRMSCLRLADNIFGASSAALAALCGKRRSESHRVLHCGIDLRRFATAPEGIARIRSELRVDQGDKIVLFVGRLDEQKNPLFVLDVVSEMRRRHHGIRAVFVGNGPLLPEIIARASRLRLDDYTHILSWRKDVAEIMASADILLWPGLESQMEGLGLVSVEAQAAGLPILVSRNIPTEAFVVEQLCNVLPLSEGPPRWAALAASILQRPRMSPGACLSAVQRSSFAIENSARALLKAYVLW